jgi:putative ABC transport system permease protein
LIVSTVTLACVLLVGAGLFIRSFSALMATDAGFNPDRMLTASLALPRSGYSNAASVRSFHDAILARASSLPGVRSAALVTDLPLERYERRSLSVEGAGFTGGVPPSTNLSWVHGPYFETLGIDLKRGRLFTDMENVKPTGVVIINERLERTFWPDEDAVGKRMRWGADVPENRNRWLTVVGVIADVADGPLGTTPFLHAYEPFSQFPNFIWDRLPTMFGRDIRLAARTNVDPLTLAPALRAEIARIDPQLAIESIGSMNERVDDVVAPQRFSAFTLGAFAAGSLLLAAIGLYGLLIFGVRESRREIAVRLALGADPSSIVWMIVGRGLKLVAVGLVAGIVVSLGVARAVRSLLYETGGNDVVAFGAAPIVLVATALLACALPAYRASRLDPTAALRTE